MSLYVAYKAIQCIRYRDLRTMA